MGYLDGSVKLASQEEWHRGLQAAESNYPGPRLLNKDGGGIEKIEEEWILSVPKASKGDLANLLFTR